MQEPQAVGQSIPGGGQAGFQGGPSGAPGGPPPPPPPGPMPGGYPGSGAPGGGRALLINFRDPSVIIRLIVIFFSLLILIFLIALTAVDEYMSGDGIPGFSFGVQKTPVFTLGYYLQYRGSLKAINFLSSVILITTSGLCFVQASTVPLHILALLKRNTFNRIGTAVTIFIPIALFFVIVLANNDFTASSMMEQNFKVLSEYTTKKYGPDVLDIHKRHKRADSIHSVVLSWSTSYFLLVAAMIFSLLNVLLLQVCNKISEGFVWTGIADRAVPMTSAYMTKERLIRLASILCTFIIAILAIFIPVNDDYTEAFKAKGPIRNRCPVGVRQIHCGKIEFKYMAKLAIAIFVLSILQAVLTVASLIINCFVHYTEKINLKRIFTLVTIGLSILSCLLFLICIILCCVHFKNDTPQSIKEVEAAYSGDVNNFVNEVKDVERFYDLNGPQPNRPGRRRGRSRRADLGFPMTFTYGSWSYSFIALIPCFILGLINIALNGVPVLLAARGRPSPLGGGPSSNNNTPVQTTPPPAINNVANAPM